MSGPRRDEGFDYDLFVIGGGSGGVRAARIAAGHGARVGLAEERYLGGTCVNVGCVPKKLLVYAAHFAADFQDAVGFGWRVGEPAHDWARLIENKDKEIGRLNRVYRHLLEGAGVEIFDARAVLADERTVLIGEGERRRAERILIATGGWPELPPEPGAAEFGITSNQAFFLPERPQRIVIAGGGYIAVEFAGIFRGLGSEVSLVHRGALPLRGFDDDLRGALAEEMVREGIDLRLGATIAKVEKAADCLLAHLSDEGCIEADAVMFAVGRRPSTAGIGLDAAGVEVDGQGAVIVGEGWRTSRPNIFAIGDVTNRLNLTPVAIAEGHALADNLFGKGRRNISYENVPTAVFSSPPIGTVGLTEAQARARGRPIDVWRSAFTPLRHTLGGRQERTLMKIVADRESGRVLGCHMLGMDAPEIVQGLAIALNCGATKADFDATIGLHPSAAEEFVTMRVKAPEPE